MFGLDPETVAFVIFGLMVLVMGLIMYGATSGKSKPEVAPDQVRECLTQTIEGLEQINERLRLRLCVRLLLLPIEAARLGYTESELRERYLLMAGKKLPTLDEFFDKKS